jgi:Skp family chaperone for outer membrane proteins
MIRKLSTFILVLNALALALIVTAAALGMRSMAAPPSSVAAVQLNTLIPLLDQDAADRIAIEQMQQMLREQRDAKLAAIDLKEKPVLDMADSPEREVAFDEINLEKLNARLWIQQAELEVIVEKALRFEKLHEAITKAIADIASAEGYDLVIVDDSAVETQVNPNSQLPPSVQRAEQLASRRILYSNPNTIDITSQLAARMNNSFKAGS